MVEHGDPSRLPLPQHGPSHPRTARREARGRFSIRAEELRSFRRAQRILTPSVRRGERVSRGRRGLEGELAGGERPVSKGVQHGRQRLAEPREPECAHGAGWSLSPHSP